MVYLKEFKLLNEDKEYWSLCYIKNIYNTLYPFKIFPDKVFEKIMFEPITIFYGGNGSGKTTLLKIISSKLSSSGNNLPKSDLFSKYVSMCESTIINNKYNEIKYIASDDVFDFILDIRAINYKVDRRKQELQEEYLNTKYNSSSYTLDEYEALKNKVDSRKQTISKYVRTRLINNNLIEHSNGESALEFWKNTIKDNSLYFLDEPENSLSAENQVKLAQFIEESARFYKCQFVISTHSPFLLCQKDAKIYDLDESPVITKKWTELNNVKVYYDFFKENDKYFN